MRSRATRSPLSLVRRHIPIQQYSAESVPPGSKGIRLCRLRAGCFHSQRHTNAVQGNIGPDWSQDWRYGGRRGSGHGRSRSLGARDADRTLIMKIPAVDPPAAGQALRIAQVALRPMAMVSSTRLASRAEQLSSMDSPSVTSRAGVLDTTPTSAIRAWRSSPAPDAEFGDKNQPVANITHDRAWVRRVRSSLDATYGSFGSPGGSAGLGFGSAKAGNF